MKKIIIYIPLVVVISLTTILFIFLLQDKNPQKPPSALINQNLPKFEIIDLFNNKNKLLNNQLKNKVVLINFFASWCEPCKVEHPLLISLKENYDEVFFLGIDHKDKKIDAIKFLNDTGNPYHFVGIDKDGKIALEFGVIGLPETFVVNKQGKIIFKHLGPLTKRIIKNDILPLIN